VNLCWAFGQLLAAGVLQGFAERTDERAYRIPFAIQWIFPLPIFAIIWFCPDSPWWLVRKGRIDEARQAIRNLSSKNSPTSADETIALIQHTIRIEEESETGTSYVDCFKGVDLRRTEIICMTFAAQVWCGSPLGGAPVYFFVNAGLSPSNAFKFNVGGLGLASIGTIVSWALLSRFGRRTLYVYGLGLLATTMLTTGAVAAGAGTGTTSSYIQAAFVVLWLLCYYLTVGPVCYAIISEMSAVRLRNKSVCISRIAYYLSQIVGNVIQPYMVSHATRDANTPKTIQLTTSKRLTPTPQIGRERRRSSGQAPVFCFSCGLSLDCPSPKTDLTNSSTSCSTSMLELVSSRRCT
jgi:SP family general alpha glucoside:H+ symporter-like MFS transporter